MRCRAVDLWEDDQGAVIPTEWVLVVMVLILLFAGGFYLFRQAMLSATVGLATNDQRSTPSNTSVGPSDSESVPVSSSWSPSNYSGDPILVKSTAATPGGYDGRFCD
jgi:hypothetical protein